jgi:hypothetical protein
MTDARRRTLLFSTLAVALAWSGWLAFNDNQQDETADLLAKADHPAKRVNKAAPPFARQKQAATPGKQTTPRMAVSKTDLFPKQTWYIPPPPPPPPPYVPPPPPQAPALPFTYMGSWQEDSETTYYLTRGNVPISVRAGQILDGAWQLEPVSGKTLNFTYLPLKQVRSLRMGD